MSDAVTCGIEINRMIYLKKEERYKHFNRLQLFDLGLDTYRVNGHTTNVDLICAGVPFITYTSETYHNRVGKSILNSLDLDELVYYSYKEYIDMAVKLATNPEYYKEVKYKIVENRTKIMFNPYLYTRSSTNLLYTIWDEYHNYNNDKNRQINHLFVNEETNEEEFKLVNHEPCKVSKFNNNYYGTPKFKWTFYENKTTTEKTYIKSVKRKQYLRDFANLQEECYAFTTEGELKKQGELIEWDVKDFKYGEPQGVWVKENIPDDEKESDINTTLNKDYQLLLICL